VGSQINQRALAIVVGIATLACRKPIAMTDNAQNGSATHQALPAVVLTQGFVPARFAPGRYATAIQRKLFGTHAMQVLSEDSTSSFTLELGADGAATACRGWRYFFQNDGPEFRSDDRYREQQGYRGHYSVVSGVAEVELALDNTVCPHLFEGQLALRRAPGLKLRCVLATPGKASAIAQPVLLCEHADGKPKELDPYVVAELAPAGWFALGSGNGLRVWVTGRPPGAYEGDDVKVTAKVADAPLGPNAWEQSF
jgi:hypothetical protein